jgi:hypothetical protein
MDVVFTHHSTQYLDLKHFAGLPDQFSYPFGKIPLQHLVAIFCGPHKVIFNFVLGMAALSVFHAKQYIQTASLKLLA